MAEKHDVVIIGSGIGGMATAVMLAADGRDVLVLEKSNVYGGRLSSHKHGDFTVDFGVHTISRGAKGLANECLKRVGITDLIPFTTVRAIVRMGDKDFKFPRDLKEMVSEEDFTGLMKFMTEVRAWLEEIAKHDDGTAEQLLNRYTENELVHSCVSRIASVYCALPAWEISAGEFMRCLKWESEAHASGYPEGGCIAIADAYMRAIQKFGGEMRLNAPVEKVAIEGGTEIEADLVISNADIQFIMLNLLGRTSFRPTMWTVF